MSDESEMPTFGDVFPWVESGREEPRPVTWLGVRGTKAHGRCSACTHADDFGTYYCRLLDLDVDPDFYCAHWMVT